MLSERLWGRVDREGPVPAIRPELGNCWLWTGHVEPNGYGRIHVAGRSMAYTHRVAWELEHGAIPPRLKIDHLCRVRHCCRPSHLEPVTHSVNVSRGYADRPPAPLSTHCRYGHEWTPENTKPHHSGHGRECRACIRRRSLARSA